MRRRDLNPVIRQILDVLYNRMKQLTLQYTVAGGWYTGKLTLSFFTWGNNL